MWKQGDNVKCVACSDEPTELSVKSAAPFSFTELYTKFQFIV